MVLNLLLAHFTQKKSGMANTTRMMNAAVPKGSKFWLKI